MGHKTDAQRILDNALSIVRDEAKREVAYHQARIGGKPFSNWSQEKHDLYHETCMVKAQTTADYCFVRMMQIDPD